MNQHRHYHKDVSHLKTIDVYRVLDLWGVTNPAAQHAIKKLLNAGQRGAKTYEQDIREAHDSIARALQMISEDCNKGQRGYPERVRGDSQDGWIEWFGGGCPITNTAAIVRFRNGNEGVWPSSAWDGCWSHTGESHDIVAYRIVGPK